MYNWKLIQTFFFCIVLNVTYSQSYNLPQQQDRWAIQSDGSIEWKIDQRLPHHDHIEMSGEKVSMWIQYGVDTSGKLSLNRTMVFPTFRLLPVRTTASMMYNVTDHDLPRFLVNDRLMKSGVYNAALTSDLPEKVIAINQKGIMQVNSEIGRDRNVKLKRVLFPSVTRPVAIEKWVFTNVSQQPVKIEMEYLYREVRPAVERTTPVQHNFVISTLNEGLRTVQPGDSAVFAITYQATDSINPFA